MKLVTPEVFLVSKTSDLELESYLKSIGDPEWKPDPQVSEAENLVEAAGRMCYRSWEPYNEAKPDATNKNVTRVRKGNLNYIKHILESGHGSVLEHATLTVIVKNGSRVYTHEQVRHRAGLAYSQESLRYVRLTDLNMYVPNCIAANPAAMELFLQTVNHLEYVQSKLHEIFAADLAGNDFNRKKELTSAFRRLAPDGLATSILVTGNIRAWRHMIAMRTSLAAEEEIRLIFLQIAEICSRVYPSFFCDMTIDEQKVCSFKHKV